MVPESVLYYVLHTRDSVILDDASARPQFAVDPYIRQHRARSILCLPLTNQARLIGALYLENNLTSRAFTPTRITVLKLIASQAAISLENTRAEEELRRSEMELRQMLDLAPQNVAVFGPGRERLYANRILLDYLGLTLEEWRQRLDRDEFAHPDDRRRVNDHFDRALSSGASFELELRLRKGDASYRWFLAR